METRGNGPEGPSIVSGSVLPIPGGEGRAFGAVPDPAGDIGADRLAGGAYCCEATWPGPNSDVSYSEYKAIWPRSVCSVEVWPFPRAWTRTLIHGGRADRGQAQHVGTMTWNWYETRGQVSPLVTPRPQPMSPSLRGYQEGLVRFIEGPIMSGLRLSLPVD